MNKLISISLLFFLIQLLSCTNSATKAFKKGQKKFVQGEFNASNEFYKLSLEKGGNKSKLNYLIAENLRLTNRNTDAVTYYKKALDAGNKEDKLTYNLAKCLKSKGDYINSKNLFDSYALNGANQSLVELSKKESKFLDTIYTLMQKDVYYKVKNMGNDINTDGPEYAPQVTKDGDLIYTASNNQFEYTAIGSGFTDIYQFKFDGITEESGIKKSFGEKINQNKTHEACPAILPDGNSIIFVRSNDGKRKNGVETEIYSTEMRDGEWQAPKVISTISDSRYWETSPTLSPDGKILYFASNRKGGFGGVDLYKSNWSDSLGTWEKPKNMGKEVNTLGNEMFPYVRNDGRFFFASDGHPGLGGLDIFALFKDTVTKETNIINLGMNINGPSDDFGICYKDRKNGYFTSNRENGKGDDDIYSFEYEVPPPKPVIITYKDYLIVNVIQKSPLDSNFQVLDSAFVTAKYDSLKTLKTGFTGIDGKLILAVDSTILYSLLAEKKGYFSNTGSFKTLGSAFKRDSVSKDLINRYYEIKINLQKITIGQEIVLEHIYYDYNKADIRHDAEPDLQLLIDFMLKNKGVVVELGSHTDSRGNDLYNLKLSQNRAKSAVAYIVKSGVDSKRIKPVGYGETKHRIKDAQTEEEHQINRRTEFKIIDVIE